MTTAAEPTLTPEQASLLASVTMTESVIAPPVTHDAAGQPIEEAPVEDAGTENTLILSALIDMLAPALPFIRDCYPPETIQRIALAYTAVEEKHGWNARRYVGVEVQLAIVAIPPTIAAVVIGRQYFASLRPEKQEVPGATMQPREKVINDHPEGQNDGRL